MGARHHDRAQIGARLLAVAALAAVLVATCGSPADAHGVGGIKPSNYRTTVTAVRPDIPGLTFRSVDNGERLEARNRTGHDLVILGYDGEPYLRVGPRGAYENLRSPAVFLNRTLSVPQALPKSADSAATPKWQRIGSEPLVRWHDHRSHWMGIGQPAAVARDPGSEHRVSRFAIEATWRGRDVRVLGDVRWIPGPAAWPWFVLVGVLAAGVILAARRRGAATVTLLVALAAALAGSLLLEIGRIGGSTEGALHKLAAAAYTIAGFVVGVIALVALLRQGAHRASPLTLLAGLFVGVGSGLASVTWITHSQLPTDISDGLVRAGIATAFGAGAGVAIVSGWILARMPAGSDGRVGPRPRTPPAPPDSPGADSTLRDAFTLRSRLG